MIAAVHVLASVFVIASAYLYTAVTAMPIKAFKRRTREARPLYPLKIKEKGGRGGGGGFSGVDGGHVRVAVGLHPHVPPPHDRAAVLVGMHGGGDRPRRARVGVNGGKKGARARGAHCAARLRGEGLPPAFPGPVRALPLPPCYSVAHRVIGVHYGVSLRQMRGKNAVNSAAAARCLRGKLLCSLAARKGRCPPAPPGPGHAARRSFFSSGAHCA